MAKKQEKSNELMLLKMAIREKNPDRLYFFHGEEIFLLQHYLEQLRKILVDELTESFNYHKLTVETFDLQSFADAVENLPMMADHTMVWVEEVDIFKLNESDREKLIDVLTDIPEYCTVIFTFETTPWKPDKRQKKFWDCIEKNGTIVEFPKQEQRELIAWISRHFAAAKKRITPDLCAYLIDITDGTMTALSGEISKICAYSGSDDIKKSDIDAVTEPVLDAVVFQMTDMMSRQEFGVALKKLRQLLQMQEEPLMILGAIGGHFRRLSTAKLLLKNGRPPAELMRLCGMNEYAARKNMSAAGKFSADFYAKASELILETDHAIKTSLDTPERLLESLIMQLAQEARNG